MEDLDAAGGEEAELMGDLVIEPEERTGGVLAEAAPGGLAGQVFPQGAGEGLAVVMIGKVEQSGEDLLPRV